MKYCTLFCLLVLIINPIFSNGDLDNPIAVYYVSHHQSQNRAQIDQANNIVGMISDTVYSVLTKQDCYPREQTIENPYERREIGHMGKIVFVSTMAVFLMVLVGLGIYGATGS